MVRKAGLRRRRGGRKGMRRMRRFKPAKHVAEWASCTESVSLTTITGLPYTVNQTYSLMSTQLAYFPNRSVQIAQAYQHYRIKKITLEFKPQIDTFMQQPGAAGVGSFVPTLYYMIDKSGSLPPNPTPENLKQMGAKPYRFDDKIIRASWRPSVLNDVTAGAVVPTGASYKISPWLSTSATPLGVGVWNPSTVDHLGIYWNVQQPGAVPGGTAPLTYDVQITVDFQFKKPLVKVAPGAPLAIQALPRTTDESLTVVH